MKGFTAIIWLILAITTALGIGYLYWLDGKTLLVDNEPQVVDTMFQAVACTLFWVFNVLCFVGAIAFPKWADFNRTKK